MPSFANSNWRLLVFSFAAAAVVPLLAGVAQLVEQLICNHQVVGSSPITGSNVLNNLQSFAAVR